MVDVDLWEFNSQPMTLYCSLQHESCDEECSAVNIIGLLRHENYLCVFEDYARAHPVCSCVRSTMAWICFIVKLYNRRSRVVLVIEKKSNQWKPNCFRFPLISQKNFSVIIDAKMMKSVRRKRPRRIIYLLLFTLDRENCLMNVVVIVLREGSVWKIFVILGNLSVNPSASAAGICNVLFACGTCLTSDSKWRTESEGREGSAFHFSLWFHDYLVASSVWNCRRSNPWKYFDWWKICHNSFRWSDKFTSKTAISKMSYVSAQTVSLVAVAHSNIWCYRC